MMQARTQQPAPPMPHLPLPRAAGMVQRSCACGERAGAMDACEACQRKKLSGGSEPIRTKLTVNRPGDPFERQADRMADLVVQRQEAVEEEEETLQARPLAVQRQAEEDEEELQTKRQAATTPMVTSAIESGIARLRQAGGQRLPRGVRSSLEPSFGHSFGDVRVHTGEEAARLARGLQARAFTVGRDVVFGAGQFAPHRPAGLHLLAHELTHTVQQGAAEPGRSFHGSDQQHPLQRRSTDGSAGQDVQLRSLSLLEAPQAKIFFPINGAALGTDDIQTIDSLARRLLASAELTFLDVRIEGFFGSDESDTRLGFDRAQAVRERLLQTLGQEGEKEVVGRISITTTSSPQLPGPKDASEAQVALERRVEVSFEQATETFEVSGLKDPEFGTQFPGPFASEAEAAVHALRDLETHLPAVPTDDATEWGTTLFTLPRGAFSYLPPFESETTREWTPPRPDKLPFGRSSEVGWAHTHPNDTCFSGDDSRIFPRIGPLYMVNHSGAWRQDRSGAVARLFGRAIPGTVCK